jgi:hypothetical protein
MFGYDDRSLDIERISESSPTPEAAADFGRRLAVTHACWTTPRHPEITIGDAQDLTPQDLLSVVPWSGPEPAVAPQDDGYILPPQDLTTAPQPLYFGFSPSEHSFFGPLSDPIPVPVAPTHQSHPEFWDYFIQGRMMPFLEVAVKRGELSQMEAQDTIEALKELSQTEAWLNDINLNPPAKVHGDLWNGNLLWTPTNKPSHSQRTPQIEAVLIDPSAHGGSYLEDLALLNLFGCPFYSQIIDAYFESASQLSGRQIRPQDFNRACKIMNLFPILGHIAFFGGSYLSQFRSILRSLTSV